MKLITKITTDRDHDKRITIQTRKIDIANFVKGKDFDDKLKNSNKDVTANKNELNELSKVKAI